VLKLNVTVLPVALHETAAPPGSVGVGKVALPFNVWQPEVVAPVKSGE
jgi:hypothetical protein